MAKNVLLRRNQKFSSARATGGAFDSHHEFGDGDVSFTSQSPSLDVIETAFKAVVSGPK